MSMAVAHFAFGAASTTLIVTVLVPAVRYPRTVALVGGCWAMIPDLHWISPVARRQLYEFHRTSTLADLFWFHRTLDRIDPADSTAVAAAMIAFFLVATAVAEWRGHCAHERLRATYENRVSR